MSMPALWCEFDALCRCYVTLVRSSTFSDMVFERLWLPCQNEGRNLNLIYRIAGNFRGIQFLRFSRLTGKPRKLNPRNKSLNTHSRYMERPSSKITSRNLCIYCLSAKIGSLENFRLYGMFMLGLGPIAVVHNRTGTSFSAREIASDYWCRPKIDRLLYSKQEQIFCAYSL